MDKLQSCELDMFQNVHNFARNYPRLFQSGTYAAELMDQMASVLEALDHNQAQQTRHKANAQQETLRKSKAKDGLRSTLKLIADISSLMERTTPGISDKFKPPRGASDAAMLHTARIFVENIAPLIDVFAKYASGADLVGELKAGIAAIEQHLREREEWRGHKKSATANIESTIKKGRELIAQLDVIVQSAGRDDKLIRGDWKVARRVRQVYRKKRRAAGA